MCETGSLSTRANFVCFKLIFRTFVFQSSPEISNCYHLKGPRFIASHSSAKLTNTWLNSHRFALAL